MKPTKQNKKEKWAGVMAQAYSQNVPVKQLIIVAIWMYIFPAKYDRFIYLLAIGMQWKFAYKEAYKF